MPLAATPLAGIVFDSAGNIYGTTGEGGEYSDQANPYGYGTVFEVVAPVGKGKYKENILWSFNGTDGTEPLDLLIWDSAGNLYGTTSRGGSSNVGVAFEVTP